MTHLIAAAGLAKTYVLHVQGGTAIPVFADAALSVDAGECVALHGPSGSGKSTLLRCLYGNCKPDMGTIGVSHDGGEIDIVSAAPRTILAIRRRTMGYVSQFLRSIPRVSALDVVAEPLRALGQPIETARARAAMLLGRLHIPERLWTLAPATFSGGEQQRVNIARGFAAELPILLLDEPTASLDAVNRRAVIDLILETKARGTALIGVFHDDLVREAVATRIVAMKPAVAGVSDELILTNARIVLNDRIAQGTVLARQGRIVAVDEAPTRIAGAIDCEGDYLIPGMVELHTDNLERHFTPRPKVHWHPAAAAMAHDAQMAAAGITTVFDAIACGDVDQGSTRIEHLGEMLTALEATQARGHLRADHRIHLRCEVSWSEVVAIFESLVEDTLVSVVSVMDHSPGQRQFTREDKYRDYFMGKHGLSAAEMDAFSVRQKEASARYSEPNRRAIAEHCRRRGLILASHDDATQAHVAEAKELGVHFSEFPTTHEAADAAHRAGMKVLMGAPNLVRGVSHSGNVSAGTLAQAGCLDILSSDYVPISLMHGVFMLARPPYGMALPEAVAKATSIPANVVALGDRGAIEAGRRADLVRVHDTGDVPVIRTVWREGRQIA